MFCEKCQSERDMSKIVERFKIPFKCSECGSIDFPYRAMNGIVFVWSEPQPEKIGLIYVPPKLNEPFRSHHAVVLSSGPGVWEKKTGRYIPSELVTGDLVWRDKETPWYADLKARDGNEYTVAYMNLLDIWVKHTYEDIYGEEVA